MVAVNIHEAKTHLSALLARVERDGETILICRYGKPVGELRPPSGRPSVDPLAMHKELSGRLLADPMEPAGEEEWPLEFR